MKTLRNPYFLLACGAYVVMKVLHKLGIHIPYLHDWLNDMLCLPVILTVTLAFQRTFVFRNPAYTFRIWHVAFTVAYAALLFEVLLPRWSPRYTADWVDVLAYAIGGGLFYAFINVPLSTGKDKLAPKVP